MGKRAHMQPHFMDAEEEEGEEEEEEEGEEEEEEEKEKEEEEEKVLHKDWSIVKWADGWTDRTLVLNYDFFV